MSIVGLDSELSRFMSQCGDDSLGTGTSCLLMINYKDMKCLIELIDDKCVTFIN